MIVQTLLVLQLLGVLIATGVAAWDIESIVFTGPVLFVTGLGIAAVSSLAGRPFGFYFGLAAPTVAVLCFSIICGLEWSPQEAHDPISLLLVGFCVLFTALGILALLERQKDGIVRRRGRFQFSIAAMLWAMVVTAIVCGCIRTDNQQRIAVSALAAYVIVVGYFVRRFHVDRRALGRDPAS